MFALVCMQTQQFELGEVIPIQRALDGLRQRKRLGLTECLSQLGRLRIRLQAARILQTYAPERYCELWAEQGVMLFFEYMPNDINALEKAAIDAACQLAPPIIDDILEERILNLEGSESLDFEIIPMGLGGIGYDDLDFNNFAESMGLLMFIKYLDTGLDDLEYWEAAGKYFGWPEGLVPDYVLYDIPVKYYDMDVFKERLRKRGLLGFMVAVEIAAQITGNLIFDYDPENEWGVMPAFSAEGLAELVQAWEAAKPIERKYQNAMARLEKDPERIYRGLLRCWNECAVYAEREPNRHYQSRAVSTNILAEMWGSEQRSEIVDPFYGPIGIEEVDDD